MRSPIVTKFCTVLLGTMISAGCAGVDPTPRVVFQQPPAGYQALDSKALLEASTTERMDYEFHSDPVSQVEAAEAVLSVLQGWDRIPNTSIFYYYRDEFALLRAKGYETDTAFCFELSRDENLALAYLPPTKKAFVILKNKPVLLLVYPDGVPAYYHKNFVPAPGAVR